MPNPNVEVVFTLSPISDLTPEHGEVIIFLTETSCISSSFGIVQAVERFNRHQDHVLGFMPMVKVLPPPTSKEIPSV
jgi:hypothetical protein